MRTVFAISSSISSSIVGTGGYYDASARISGGRRMTADIAYHLTELKIVSNKGDPRRIVPNYSCGGWRVLDIGCGIGQTLVSEELSEAAELHGVDSDSELVNCRVLTDREPRLRLIHAAAESLPFPGTYFDLVYSRVAVPYTNIPVAMSEAFRVLKPGGISG
jgi:ubiquinone/menaquinone biosynthesis C-methylase UbiE